MKYLAYLVEGIDAAFKAGIEILNIYQTDFDIETKKDSSPLTVADMRSHEIINENLMQCGIPSISEEGQELAWVTRRNWSLMWVVDPLDGTKEFIKRNGEFTVNIALVQGQRPVMGIVYAPKLDFLYYGTEEIGAYKLEKVLDTGIFNKNEVSIEERYAFFAASAVKLPVKQDARRPYTIVGSRSHATPDLDRFVEKKREKEGDVKFMPAGSSLKICLVAEGVADVYPRFGPTMEWDTAAGHAIAEFSGATICKYEDKTPLVYNKKDLLNPWFIVERRR